MSSQRSSQLFSPAILSCRLPIQSKLCPSSIPVATRCSQFLHRNIHQPSRRFLNDCGKENNSQNNQKAPPTTSRPNLNGDNQIINIDLKKRQYAFQPSTLSPSSSNTTTHLEVVQEAVSSTKPSRPRPPAISENLSAAISRSRQNLHSHTISLPQLQQQLRSNVQNEMITRSLKLNT